MHAPGGGGEGENCSHVQPSTLLSSHLNRIPHALRLRHVHLHIHGFPLAEPLVDHFMCRDIRFIGSKGPVACGTQIGADEEGGACGGEGEGDGAADA